jgi:hypothetical protein
LARVGSQFLRLFERRSVWLKGQKSKGFLEIRFVSFQESDERDSLLVSLLVVVDLVVPEDGLKEVVISYNPCCCACDAASAYLVTVTPEVVLGADVLEGVLGLLGLGGHVGLVLPVLEPQAVGVDTAEDDRGDNDAVLRDSRSEL